MKEYASSYYQKNREKCIARQMEYHNRNRERYLEYMRSYNKLYWLVNKPEPKPKKEKKAKVPKEPKPPKPAKVKEKKPYKERPPKEHEWYVVPTYVPPTRMEYGNFILEF